MHAAASPLRTPGGSAEKFGEQLAGRKPLGKGMTVTAVRAEDDILSLKMCADARGDGLLADVSVASAVDKATLMRPCELLFATANEHHRSIEGQELVFVQMSEGFTGHGGFRSQQTVWRTIDFQGMQEIILASG
jgi:hypothetical protein